MVVGFPKSMDISKQIDKRNGRTNNDFIEFGQYLKEKRGNIPQTEISKLFPSKNGGLTGRVFNWEKGLELPNKEQYAKLKKILGLDDRYDYLIEKEQAKREIIGKGKAGLTKGTIGNFAGTTEFEITAPATNLAKQWKGWGTCLKPSFEPIIIARKPFKGSLVDNVIKWGVGGLNIDECRVGNEIITQMQKDMKPYTNNKMGVGYSTKTNGIKTQTIGRFPANTILTYDQITFDEVCGGFPNTKGNGNIRKNKNNGKGYNCYSNYGDCETRGYEDSGSASRYFYCAKASKKDRDEGLERFDEKLPACVTDFRPTLATNPQNWNNGNPVDNPMMRTAPRKNIHPTVKPTELMQYLVRLVSPRGATILDPFMGSGSTGKAVAYENRERQANYNFIGIELNKEYCDIAEARIKFVKESE